MNSVLIPKSVPAALVLALSCLTLTSAAQDWGGLLKRQLEQQANQLLREAVDAGANAVRGAAQGGGQGEAPAPQAQPQAPYPSQPQPQSQSQPVPGDSPSAPASWGQAGEGARRAAPQDRFTAIVEQAPPSTVTKGGFVVNNKRVAVQQELSRRPPTREELGVALPRGSRMVLYETALQIAQYHPHWRIYEYRVDMPQAEFIRFFTDQGLSFDRRKFYLRFPAPFGGRDGDFIDLFTEDPVTRFRIWRRP